MAWQRKIPFGYVVQNGELLRNETEAAAVQTIYAMYRSGNAYSQIAAEMERQGIPYHAHTPQWNKHMVKRILENQRYLGQDGFPRLISDEDYHAVDRQKADKASHTPCPASIHPIRKKAVCGLCGAKMTRDTKSRHPRWRCQDPACGYNSRIRDETLERQVQIRLQELAQTPHLLARMPIGQASVPHSDALRLQNELTHALNRGDAGIDYMKALVFAIAAEQYSDIRDPTPHHQMEQLRERLARRPPDADDLRELLESVVQEIRIRDDEVELRLMDGTILGTTGRKEWAT